MKSNQNKNSIKQITFSNGKTFKIIQIVFQAMSVEILSGNIGSLPKVKKTNFKSKKEANEFVNKFVNDRLSEGYEIQENLLCSPWKKYDKIYSLISVKNQLKFIYNRFKTAEITDLYNSDWFKNHYKDFRNNSNTLSYKEFLKANAVRINRIYLLLAIDDYRVETKDELIKAWPGLKKNGVVGGYSKTLGLNTYDPDFLLFNTSTKQILAFGLGRKNNDFMFAIDKKNKINKKIRDVDDFLHKTSSFKNVFLKYDYAGLIEYLLQSFKKVSIGWNECGSLPLNDEQVKEILGKNPTKKIYYDQFGDKYTKEELINVSKIFKEADNLILSGEDPFRQLFKNCSFLQWELNTSDF